MKKIPLTQGKFALVDDEDYERLAWFPWHAFKSKTGVWYARRNAGEPETIPRKTVLLHRAVLGFVERDPDVDHRDGDGLNNQKSNLRMATKGGNTSNTKVRRDSKSGLKGVYWSDKDKRWCATIRKDGRSAWLGGFYSAHEAAEAYDIAAIEIHGEFARTNFPRERYQ